jgi:hypothetical protein
VIRTECFANMQGSIEKWITRGVPCKVSQVGSHAELQGRIGSITGLSKAPDTQEVRLGMVRVMTQDQDIAIALSPAQIEQVIRSAGHTSNGTVSSLLLAALDNAHSTHAEDPHTHESLQEATHNALTNALGDPQLSQSLLRGLAILSCYGPERPWRAIIDLAKELSMSPSTTHRYVKTLRAVGLLEQNPDTREYRPVAV